MDQALQSGLVAPEVPISWGELIDKITILEIKAYRLNRADAIGNVNRELSLLLSRSSKNVLDRSDINDLRIRLKSINETLWDIEDRIRSKEAAQRFDEEFIELARSVYRTNDERASIKRKINVMLGSGLIEEKSYHGY